MSLPNPFAGLRPYDVEESYLFFGRERAVDELLGRLGRDNFLAVLGPSGSGKSSVVRAGLIPALEGGQLRRAGARWRVAILRPGGDPFGHLATALAEQRVFGEQLDEEQQRAIARAQLKRGSKGLSQILARGDLDERENLLVLVDQFEELFRFADAEDHAVQFEAAAFVQLLLDAAEAPTPRLYVALTMRSDFLGDCARFRGLAEAMSRHLYLVPRMTRAERRSAIEGPVAIGGARIKQRLVSRLLNEAGDTPDLLPVLQHALQQTWEHARPQPGDLSALDYEHYEAAGGLEGALDQHAEAALAELDEPQQALARRLFQTITVIANDNRGVRRPARLGRIAEILGVDVAELEPVIEPFRSEGRGFLMPRPSEAPALQPDSVIDISHEALMRGWSTLKRWVTEEAESVAVYRRLAQTAAQFPDDPEWRYLDPALTNALHWRERTGPTKAWADQHEPNFEQAMAFLDRSVAFRDAQASAAAAAAEERLRQAEALAEAEREAAEEARRGAARTRRFLLAVALLLLFALGAALAALGLWRTAQVARDEAETAAEEARVAELKAEANARRATEEQARTQRALDELRASQDAEAAARDAERAAKAGEEDALAKALDAKRRAEEQRDRAREAEAGQKRAAADALAAREVAELQAARAEIQRVRAVLRQPVEDRGRELTNALASVLAVGGEERAQLAPDFAELLRDFAAPDRRLGSNSRAVTLSPSGRTVLFGLDRGGALRQATASRAGRRLKESSGVVRAVAWGGDRVAFAGDGGGVYVWDGSERVALLEQPEATALAWRGSTLVSGGSDGRVRSWDVDTGEATELTRHRRAVHQLAVGVDGAIASGSDDGRVCVIEAETVCADVHQGWVRGLDFGAGGLASVGDDGALVLLSAAGGTLRATPIAKHGAPASSVQWVGGQLLTGSYDGTARLWTRGGEEVAAYLGHQDWVWTARSLGDFVVTASEDGRVRFFSNSGELLLTVSEAAPVKVLDASRSGRHVAWAAGRTGRVVDVPRTLGDAMPSAIPELVAIACGWLEGDDEAAAALGHGACP